jgi:hypothetical protein
LWFVGKRVGKLNLLKENIKNDLESVDLSTNITSKILLYTY